MPIPVTCACGKAYLFKDEFAGRHAKCPKCQAIVRIPGTQPVTAGPAGPPPPARPSAKRLLAPGVKELQVNPAGPIANHAQTPVAKDNFQGPKSANGFGIAALAMGIIGCISAWMPCIGLLSIPISGLGFIFGMVGLTVALIGKRSSAGMPITGSIICVAAIGIAFLATWGTGKALEHAASDLNKELMKNQPGDFRANPPPNSALNKDLMKNQPGDFRANAPPNSAASINLNDLKETKRHVSEVFKGWEEDEAQAVRRTQGNQLAAKKEIPEVRERNLRKLTGELAKLNGQAVVWRFTVHEVMDGFITFEEAPNTGYAWPNDSDNPFFIWFGDRIEHRPGFLTIEKNLPQSTAEKLRPGDVLVIRGMVRVSANTANVNWPKVPIGVLISNTQVTVAE